MDDIRHFGALGAERLKPPQQKRKAPQTARGFTCERGTPDREEAAAPRGRQVTVTVIDGEV
jgi:hypothetical protein